MKFGVIKSTTLIAALVAVLSVGTTVAQEADIDPAAEGPDSHQERKGHMRKMMKERQRHMEQRMNEHLNKLDINEDGSVDLNEYLSNAEQRFNDMDLDSNQLITQDEARQAHKQMRDRMHSKRRNALGKHHDPESEATESQE